MSRGLKSRKAWLVVSAGVAAMVAVAVPSVAAGSHQPGNAWPYDQSPASTLVAVGDIACEPAADGSLSSERCQRQLATANLTESLQPDLVAILGDEQYQTGTLSNFEASFDKSWGGFKFLQRPAPTGLPEPAQNGKGYFEYYNGYLTDPASGPRPAGQAGEPGKGYYSYNLGAWHVIALNAECENQVGGCDPNGAWLAAQTQCVVGSAVVAAGGAGVGVGADRGAETPAVAALAEAELHHPVGLVVRGFHGAGQRGGGTRRRARWAR